MNESSHYIASTAIQGAPAHRNGQISIDVYSQLDLHPEQLTYLYSDHIPARNNTIAFEYGAKIDYADRAHLFPSGTGSIDQSNAILHQGKLLPQLDRSIENVESLLRAGGAELADMTHLIAYLRDPADEGKIRVALDERFPHLPTVVVHAPVCDPRWLVEIECAAIIPQRNSSPIGASKVSAFPRF
jgi:enamine deaminase RidA (YjgF/YER057c/UK114 family)